MFFPWCSLIFLPSSCTSSPAITISDQTQARSLAAKVLPARRPKAFLLRLQGCRLDGHLRHVKSRSESNRVDRNCETFMIMLDLLIILNMFINNIFDLLNCCLKVVIHNWDRFHYNQNLEKSQQGITFGFRFSTVEGKTIMMATCLQILCWTPEVLQGAQLWMWRLIGWCDAAHLQLSFGVVKCSGVKFGVMVTVHHSAFKYEDRFNSIYFFSCLTDLGRYRPRVPQLVHITLFKQPCQTPSWPICGLKVPNSCIPRFKHLGITGMSSQTVDRSVVSHSYIYLSADGIYLLFGDL